MKVVAKVSSWCLQAGARADKPFRSPLCPYITCTGIHPEEPVKVMTGGVSLPTVVPLEREDKQGSFRVLLKNDDDLRKDQVIPMRCEVDKHIIGDADAMG